MARAKHIHHNPRLTTFGISQAVRDRWLLVMLTALLLLTAAPAVLEADSGVVVIQSHGIELAAAEQRVLRVDVAELAARHVVRAGLSARAKLPLPRALGGEVHTARRSARLLDVAFSQVPERLRERVPWLNGTGVVLGALGMAAFAAGVIELLTLRSSRDAQAWTLRVGGPQLILRRRF